MPGHSRSFLGLFQSIVNQEPWHKCSFCSLKLLKEAAAIVRSWSDAAFRNGFAAATRIEKMSKEIIEVNHSTGDEWSVTVKGAVTTHHRVRMSKAELDHLGQGRSAEEMIEESFRFLLEREPNTSIPLFFAILLIGRYFPEYETEIRARLIKLSSGTTAG